MDFDEGGKEIRNAIAKLLDVGVLVSRSFVAVGRDALVDGVPIEVESFSERLHDELLEIL